MFKKIIALAAAVILSLSCLVGCGGDKYDSVHIDGAQDTSYKVVGNGGSVVQYGNYVYFLNGTRGYDDADGTANKFGGVVKGAVYRAELTGEKSGSEFKQNERSEATGLGLVSHKEERDYSLDGVNVVDVQRVAPKTVGTSGYAGGGITIIGDCMYYASPNDQRDRSGAYQYSKTDFFRMTLDGKTTRRIYTTSADSASSPYGFMLRRGTVYLVVLDGTDLKSVPIKSNGKAGDVITLATGVTSAIIPTKPVYYAGISEDTIYDFVYIERAATEDDISQSGEILEFVRPDGSAANKYKFEDTAMSSYTLETVRDGYLFYRVGDDKLVARDMTAALAKGDESFARSYLDGYLKNSKEYGSKYTESGFEAALNEYIAALEKRDEEEKKKEPTKGFARAVEEIGEISREFDIPEGTTTVYPYVPDYDFDNPAVSNCINVIAVTDSEATLYEDAFGGARNFATVVSGSGVSVAAVTRDRIFTIADGAMKSTYVGAGSDFVVETIASNVTAGTFGADVAAGYLVYFGEIDADVTGYTFFYEIDGGEGNNEPQFVGELLDGDKPSHTESISVVTEPDKTEYTVGESLNTDGLVVEAVFNADSSGRRPEPRTIEITDDMLSGFDSSAAGDVTVTVTYDKKTTTFTVTVVEGSGESTSAKGCGTIVPFTPWFFIGGGGLLILSAGVLFFRRRSPQKA